MNVKGESHQQRNTEQRKLPRGLTLLWLGILVVSLGGQGVTWAQEPEPPAQESGSPVVPANDTTLTPEPESGESAVSSPETSAAQPAPSPPQKELAPIVAEPVMVTAELQPRTVQEAQTSVTVVRGEVLDQSTRFRDIKDIYSQTANVTDSVGGLGVTIRGIESRGVGGAGAGLLVNVNVDGASAQTAQGIYTSGFSIWDVGQVEILRGPQSTQRGRNALAGAILIRSKDPTFEQEFKSRFDYGRFNEHRVAAAANLALSDTLAVRFSGEQFGTDGFITNLTRNEDDYSKKELQTARAKLRWRPNDRIDVILGHTLSDNIIGTPHIDFGADGKARVYRANELMQEEAVNNITNLRINFDVNSRWALFSETTYYNTDYITVQDADGTAADRGSGFRTIEDTSITQEVRASYRGETVNGVAGVYFTDTDTDLDFVASFPGAFFGSPQSLITGTNGQRFDATNFAVFGEVELNLFSNWTFIVGGRYDREQQTDISFASFTANPPLPFPLPSSPPTKTEADFSAFLPKGSVIYHWTDEVSTGFTVQRGYRSGGAGLDFVGNRNQFDAEYTTNYELAFRSTWLNNRLTANANVFYTDWTDQQVTVLGPGGPLDFRTVNAGKSELYGFELDTKWQVNSNLNVSANLGHTRTRFKEFLTRVGNDLVDFAGNQFPFAPQWTGSVGGTYFFDNGFVIDAIGNYTSSSFEAATNLPGDKSDSYFVVNGRVGYEADSWSAFVFARNLFDRTYLPRKRSDPGGDPFDNIGEPRIIGVMITATGDLWR